VNSLVEYGKIQTTVAKAKELRRHVERAVTLGKNNTLHTRRLLMARFPNVKTVEKILTQWSPHFKNRNGGYTRIMKLGPRPGDSAEMAVIEFLDYAKFAGSDEKPAAKKKTAKAKKSSGSAEKAAAPEKSASGKAEGASGKKTTAKKATKKAAAKKSDD
jgi:large subunit ribosomal protein L17